MVRSFLSSLQRSIIDLAFWDIDTSSKNFVSFEIFDKSLVSDTNLLFILSIAIILIVKDQVATL